MRDEGPSNELAELSSMFGSDVAVVPTEDPAIAARRRRRGRIAGWSTLAVVLVIVGIIGTYIPVTLNAPLPAATVTELERTVPQPEPLPLTMPTYGVLAASITGAADYTGADDGIFVTNGGNEARPIASISKVLTALIILGAKPLGEAEPGPTITFDKADNDLYDKYYSLGATIERMPINSTMSQRDALAVMLISSASNYAEAMANWAFGSPAGFRAAAAEWIAANGLTGTTLLEPTGFDPRNASTPTDLIAIGRLAMADPVVASLVQSQSYAVPGRDTVYNRNTLLGQEGVNGIKTGTLDEAGACLLFSAVVSVGAEEPLTIVGVVLGGVEQSSVATEVLRFLESIRAASRPFQVIGQGAEFGTLSVPWQDDVDIVARRNAELLVWSDTPVTSVVELDEVSTVIAGSTVGTVTYTAGSRSVTVPLIVEDAIEAPDDWWRLTHPG